VTYVTFPPAPGQTTDSPTLVSPMRLPGAILQGILARASLVLLRVYVGVVFLVRSVQKLQGESLKDWGRIGGTRLEQAPQIFQHVFQDVVLPNADIFRLLLLWGELFLGVFLIVGLLTRLWAVAALLLSLGYVLMEPARPWTPASADALLAVTSLAILIGAAGRTLGVDSWLAHRWPRSPLW
jgi:thiosulfate dehydrogenase [quinone] large subunit